ncbi:helix-turn-helix domain-containing protein [Jeotgalibaca porci]|uniref:helix-turn-helix domain-containing protein n=1 Tax=Jeotgalibaca porci TaxID=1868793 RepID=UPI00359F7111
MKTLLNKKAVRELMLTNDYDAYSLAEKMNVAPSTIYRILNGDRGVGGELIPKLLKAFDLTEKDFDKLFIFSEMLPFSNDEKQKIIQ